MSKLMKKIYFLALFFSACVLPSFAHAHGLKGDDASGDFSDSPTVSDKDLSKMRGGFINLNGMLIDISYTAVASVNGNVISNVSLNTNDIAQAVQNGGTLQSVLPPTVIQNVNNTAIIAMQQQLSLNISGAAAQAAAQEQIHQLTFQNTLAFH